MRRLAVVATVAGVAAVAAACSSSAASAPVLTPAEAEIMYARYSGSWTLVPDLSDEGDAALQTEVSERRGDNMGERPESTAQAIRPTYRRAGEARAQQAARMDRTSMRQTIVMAGQRPETLRLAMSDAGLEVQYDDREAWLLPLEGGRVEVEEDLLTVEVRLVWEDGLPIIERQVGNGGTIREILETAPNGGTLWLTRQVVIAAEGWQPAQFTFSR